jgi:hypothetical protein
VKTVAERTINLGQQSSQSLLGSVIVLSSTAFLAWILIDKEPRPIDGILRNWITVSGVGILVWLTRRGAFGRVPSILRGLTALLLPFFGFLTCFGLVIWPPFWRIAEPLGLVRSKAEPIAIAVVLGLWVVSSAFIVLRGLFRWFSRRYEHHGIALGFGPLYFYFRRRRV